MTEQIRRQVSLFMDDELSPEECELFVRRFRRDEESRNLFMRYQVIGAAIRGEHISAEHSLLRSNLQAELGHSSGKNRTGSAGWLKAIGGVGIAASVAIVSLSLLDRGADSDVVRTPVVAAATEQRLERVEPPSYVVPLQAPVTPIVAPAVRLTDLQYLMHHSGHGTSLSRTVAHTNVLAADSEDVVTQAEQEAAPQ